MKLIGSLIGLIFGLSVSAEPLIEGRVRLDSGEPVADAQVRLFDMTDLRQGAIARATTDDTGYFALPLAALTGSVLPTSFTLGPNYPNPFNPSTIIPYQLATSSQVRLEVFNLLGQHIATLVDGERPAGFHTATWTAVDGTGRAVGAGVYIYRMTVGVESQTGRMVLIDGQAGISAGGTASVLSGASGGSGPDGEGAQVYGLIVSGRGLVPYVDSAFRVESGMAPVELVLSVGQYSAGKVTDDDEQAVIPDAKLRAAIAAALGKARGETITKGEMETLTILVAKTADISDLTGLEFATNLTLLVLDNNRITDVSALLGLTNLRILNLKGNPLSASSINDHIPALQARGVTVQFDPTPIDDPTPVTIPDAKLRAVIASALGKARGATITKSEMEALRRLTAQGVGISDLTGLEFAANLNSLYLWNNQIADLAPLAELTNLTNLNLYNNQITDLSPLAGLTKLNSLGLNKNQIADLAPLAELTNLTNLNLYNNQITDLSPLAGLTKLTNLDLNGNTITDVSALAELTNLRELNLNGNTITDVSALAELTNLRELNLNGNTITDVSALAELTNLETLGLSDNQITDISALAELTKLRILRLNDNPLSASSFNDHIPALQARGVTVGAPPNPTPVTIPDANLRAAIAAALGKASGATITKGEMETLRRLDADDADISDLTGLEFANNLKVLGLSGNDLTDISALAGLTNLTSLTLHWNDLTAADVSALADLTNLTWLGLADNQIKSISALRRLTNLEKLGLSDNQITDISALAGLTNLEGLYLGQNDLTDVSALAGLTSLTFLRLEQNDLTDVSALAGLTSLTFLRLDGNDLTDISALRRLTNLRGLWLDFNNVSDLSPLRNLTNLTELLLHSNNVSDLSSLRNLTNLETLNLDFNNVTDVSPLQNLTNLETLNLRGNFLNSSSINDHIPALKNSGATVGFDKFRESDFDIELVFLADFTEKQKRVIQYAARHWMSIIREDLPDYTFTYGLSRKCGDQYEIPSGERIDDLRIYITGSHDDSDDAPAGWAGPDVLRETSYLSVVGCMWFNLKNVDSGYFLDTALHEIGHVLGFGTIWYNLGFLQNPSRGGNEGADTHFNGPLAMAAFDAAGGSSYTGRKVPVRNDGQPRSADSHWRFSVFGDELMAAGDEGELFFSEEHYEVRSALSAITILSLADLGYSVDVTQTNPYTLPTAAVKPSAKVSAPTTHAQPKWTCGTGQHEEPMYVVDPQGNIIRTLHR